MTIDFSTISWDERPTLLLKNLDGTIIAPLSYAHNIELKANYNEISELTWTLPRYVDGVETEAYKDVVGMRIVDLPGVGQFSIVNPKVTSKGGMLETKECKAYSLEYELQSKSTSYLIEGTYELYNPVAPKSTALGILLEDYPSWRVGSFDSDLVGKYRTFDNISSSLYETMKDSFEKAYQCVFSFDTYARTINVRAVTSIATTKQVYISHDNLAKQIEIEEDTENIFTALDVNGAEDVDIRSVNPMGTNVIYNLDYFMNTSYFSQSLIDKWNQWKTTYEDYRKPYYDLTVAKVLQESKLVTQNAAIIKLTNELNKFTELQSVYVEGAASGGDYSDELAEIKQKIADKVTEISNKRDERNATQDVIDAAYAQQLAINRACSWDNFFTNEEIKLLDRYIKKDAIEETSFVYKEYASYVTPDTAKGANSATFRIDGATVAGSHREDGTKVYSITGGELTLNATSADTTTISFTHCEVISASAEVTSDKKYVFTAYLRSGTQDETTFPRASLTIIGIDCTMTSDASTDDDIGGTYIEGATMSSTSNTSDLYFTQNTTEYTKRSVEWDLYEFGQQQLDELAFPSYTFSVDSANFLALEDFELFKNNLELGEKIYLDLDGQVLKPICIGVEMSFEDPSQFKLIFGDKYSLKDSAFELVDLLEESVSMGKAVAKNRRSYNSFIDSGASSEVRDFMNSALDAAKNMVLGGSNEETIMDGSGVRLRKYNESTGDYEPEQVWLKSNLIAFTTDNWSSVKQAFGHMKNGSDVDVWGLIADSIIGKLIAGTNLTIESEKKDGGVAVFKMDANGAVLYNSQFDVVNEYEVEGTNNKGWIKLQSPLGIVAGVDSPAAPLFGTDVSGNTCVYTNDGNLLDKIKNIDYSDAGTLPRASFWADMYGNAFFKGNVYANSGVFNGTVYANAGKFTGEIEATSGKFSGTIYASKLAGTLEADETEGGILKGIGLNVGNGNFVVNSSGDVTMAGSIDLSRGSISWGTNAPVKYQFSVDGSSNWHDTMTASDYYRRDSLDGGTTWGSAYKFRGQDGSDADVPSYIHNAYIDFSSVNAPYLRGNSIELYGGHFSVYDSNGSNQHGFVGHATGSATNNAGDSFTTNGVALSAGLSNTNISYTTVGNYIIATTHGIRMHSGSNVNLYLTPSGAYYDNGNGAVEIGGSTAVFG